MSSSTSVTALIAIALKWLVLGRTKPGRYPLWGVYYFRWWLVQRLEPLVHIKWLQGSPMMRRLPARSRRQGRRRRRSSPTSTPARSTSSPSATAPRIGAQDRDRQCRGRSATSWSSARSTSATTPISAPPASIGHDVRDRRPCRARRPDRDPAGHRRRRGREAGTARPGARSAWSTSPRCRPSPRRRRRRARRCSTLFYAIAARGDPAGQPAADLPGLLHLRPDRRCDLRLRSEVQLSLVPAGARLADGDRHDLRAPCCSSR